MRYHRFAEFWPVGSEEFNVRPVLCAISFAIAATLAGGPVSANKAQAFDRIYKASLPFFFASDVAAECRSIQLKRNAFKQFDAWLKAQTKAAGLKKRDFDKALNGLSDQKIATDMGAFRKKYRIKPKDRASWCAAGMKMIAAKDAVGQYLVAK